MILRSTGGHDALLGPANAFVESKFRATCTVNAYRHGAEVFSAQMGLPPDLSGPTCRSGECQLEADHDDEAAGSACKTCELFTFLSSVW
jgi:hypothetical protein